MIERDITLDDHFFLGEDKLLKFTHQGTGSIAGYLFRFNIKSSESDSAPELFVADNVTLGTLVITSATDRTYEVNMEDIITDGSSWKPSAKVKYYWSVKKLNPGAELIVAKGSITFGSSTQRRES